MEDKQTQMFQSRRGRWVHIRPPGPERVVGRWSHFLFLAQVRDVWYEAGTVWYVHKDGFALGECQLWFGERRSSLQNQDGPPPI